MQSPSHGSEVPPSRSARTWFLTRGMPATIPEEVRDLFDEPALAHVSYLSRKAQIVTFPMCNDVDGEEVMVSSPIGPRKAMSFQKRPQVDVSRVSTKNPWHCLSLTVRVVDI